MGLTLYQSITPTSTQGVEEEQEVIFFSSSLGILYLLRRQKDTFLQIENTNIQIQKYKNTLMKIRNTNNNMTTIDRNYSHKLEVCVGAVAVTQYEG